MEYQSLNGEQKSPDNNSKLSGSTTPTKSAAMKHDFNTAQLLEILKNSPEDDEDDSTMATVKNMLFSMLPSPSNLADLAAGGKTLRLKF
jgi:hypothetical protein